MPLPASAASVPAAPAGIDMLTGAVSETAWASISACYVGEHDVVIDSTSADGAVSKLSASGQVEVSERMRVYDV